MTTPIAKYTVRKVEVFRVFDERGQEVCQHDDEYGREYPLDFESEAGAWAHVAEEESFGFHGPLTKEETATREMYARFAMQSLMAKTPFLVHTRHEAPLPMNGGKTIQFLI